MPGRGIKKLDKKLNTDFSITDAAKRIRRHKDKLRQYTEVPEKNEIDMMNEELENASEPSWIRKIFGD